MVLGIGILNENKLIITSYWFTTLLIKQFDSNRLQVRHWIKPISIFLGELDLRIPQITRMWMQRYLECNDTCNSLTWSNKLKIFISFIVFRIESLILVKQIFDKRKKIGSPCTIKTNLIPNQRIIWSRIRFTTLISNSFSNRDGLKSPTRYWYKHNTTK